MAIKLRIISDQYRDLGEQRSRVFGVNGGTIGRAPDNDWILPDPKRVLSGHHCEIEYRSGVFWLKDTSTNGVYVNEAEEPAFTIGPIELQDGDRLRMGDFEVLVSLDSRIDFLPSPAEQQAAARHNESNLGAPLDLQSLLSPRDAADTGYVKMRTAFGTKIAREERKKVEMSYGQDEPPQPPHSNDQPFAAMATVPVTPMAPPVAPAAGASPAGASPAGVSPAGVSPAGASAAGASAAAVAPPRVIPAAAATAEGAVTSGADADQVPVADWALKTRQITRQELADAVARRAGRADQRERAVPFHQQASTWTDLKSALQAFGRGAGIDANALSPEAQAVLPLLAGQLLREVVVGLTDALRARPEPPNASPPVNGAPVGTNPLRTSSSIEQALQRLFESHGRLYGGPVEALRDVLQDIKEHDVASQDAARAGIRAVLEQLAPTNIADQFEHGRARALAPGQDPRPKYWEHYNEFFRVLTQQGSDALPHPYVEAFARAYAQARTDLRAKRRAKE
jgi:type VI secretion system protein